MEKMLIVGVNTRPLAHSAYELGYEIFSTSYFCTTDFKRYHHKKCAMKQRPYYSCGFFEKSYHPLLLVKLSSSYIDEVDKIITYTGVLPEQFPRSKILGNKKVENVDNKYKLYKTLKNKFHLPSTYLISEVKEAKEIKDQFPEKEFIIKPLSGSGGYGIKKWGDVKFESFPEGEFLLQEYVSGENVSASVLSTKDESKTILTSKQLILENFFEGKFIYGGNITPFPGEDKSFRTISQEVIEELSLIGSNGVDMIIKDDEIYIIEVNPRIQGTFECAEASLGINMIEAHIKACQGELINCPPPKKYTIKRIIYSEERYLIGNLKGNGIYDLPLKNSIIEKGQPMVTLLQSSKNLDHAWEKLHISLGKVKRNLKKVDNNLNINDAQSK